MSWTPYLPVEILMLFAEAQRSIERGRLRAEARSWLYHHRVKARRRDLYASHRALGSAVYRATLERARENSRRYRAENHDALAAMHAARNAEARAARVGARVCANEKCSNRVAERVSRSGPTPVFCSERCARRTAKRNWWRRRHEKRPC